MNAGLPTGTVTFVFTDIEGSTRLVQSLGDSWPGVLETHNRLLKDRIVQAGGVVVKTEGDAFFAVFSAPVDAVAAAVEIQRALASHSWPPDATVRVRIGIHTGVGVLGGDDYVGIDVHRAARIAGSAHGGQTVISEAVAVLTEHHLPPGVSLRDAGKHRLKDLTHPETLFEVVAGDLPSDFPPLRTLEAVPNNLPLQVTSFVGRAEELAEARRLLSGTRVLTLTGPGGTGKTRLALQLGGEVGGDFRHGVYFVDLAPVSDPEVVPSVVLSTLGAQDGIGEGTPAEALLESLADREVLLILDNFEQILGAAPLVAEMVRASPMSRFLVTSRAPLHISSEQIYPLAPMSVPNDKRTDSDAVRLFVERASAVQPDFCIDDRSRAAVVDLVRRLDGLPLAIELIASRVRLLPVATIAERFDSHMLQGGAVDLPERQRTIDGAIGWSHQLLNEDEQRLFARMSVFAGGARLEQVEQVCGPGIDVFAALTVLLDHSLVRRFEGEGEPRFRMLHVIREFAARCLDKSGEAQAVQRRHLEAFVALAESTSPQLKGAERRRWLNLLAFEHDNFRAAFQWARDEGETDLARRLAFSMWRFWQARGFLYEGKRRLFEAVEMKGGSEHWKAKALEGLGGILWWRAEGEACLEAYGAALALQRELGDPAEIANALYNHALALGFLDVANRRQAVTELDEAEGLFEQLGETGGMADVAWARGNLSALLGHPEEGAADWARSLELYERAGNEFGVGWALYELALAARASGDHPTAWEHLSRGLRIFADHGDVSAAVMFMASMGALAIDMGDEPRGVRLGGSAHELRLASGTDIVTHDVNRIDALSLDRLESLTGDLRAAYLEGRDMDFDRAVAYALAGPVDDPSVVDLLHRE